jgi:hypothetical protein
MPHPPDMCPRFRSPRQRGRGAGVRGANSEPGRVRYLPLRTAFPQALQGRPGPCKLGKYARTAGHRGLHCCAGTARDGAAARRRAACKPVSSSNHDAGALGSRGKNCARTAASGKAHRHWPGWRPLAGAAPDDRRPPALEAWPRGPQRGARTWRLSISRRARSPSQRLAASGGHRCMWWQASPVCSQWTREA